MNINIQTDWISDKVCVISLSRLFIVTLARQLDDMVEIKEKRIILKEHGTELRFSVERDNFFVDTSPKVISIYADYSIILNLSSSLKSFLFYEDHREDAYTNRLDISLELYGATFMPNSVKDVVIENIQTKHLKSL